LDPNPETRLTVKRCLKHPFLALSTEEIAESKDASNFISFFSIVASQVSSNQESMQPNSRVSNDNLDYIQNQLTESSKTFILSNKFHILLKRALLSLTFSG